MLIEVIGPPIRHERVLRRAGERLEVPDLLAVQFIRLGRATRVESSAARVEQKRPIASTQPHNRKR